MIICCAGVKVVEHIKVDRLLSDRTWLGGKPAVYNRSWRLLEAAVRRKWANPSRPPARPDDKRLIRSPPGMVLERMRYSLPRTALRRACGI